MATVHIIGAGIGGLAAATSLAKEGVPVKLYEASNAAGGRARSSTAAKLGTIDHGLHLLKAGDRHMMEFTRRIDTYHQLQRIPFPYRFADAKTGEHWNIRPRHPLPNLPLRDLALLLWGLANPAGRTLDTLLPADSPLHEEWLRPIARLLLAENPEHAPARTLRRELLRLLRGHGALYMAKASLAESFVGPALHHLEYYGGSVYFGQALRDLQHDGTQVKQLGFVRNRLPLYEDDAVILATPARVTQKFLPQLNIQASQHSTITLHYQLAHREAEGVRFIASGPFDLLRYREGMISATIRLADGQWHADQALLAERLWRAMQKLHPYLRGTSVPAWALWREKEAGHTLSAHPHTQPLLPKNLFLAGDWLDPSRPPSLEAAAKSGHVAADAAMQFLGKFPERKQQRL